MLYIIFCFMFGILIGLFIRQGKFLGQLKKDHDALCKRFDNHIREEVGNSTLPTQQNKNCVGVETLNFDDIEDVDFEPVSDRFIDAYMDIE